MKKLLKVLLSLILVLVLLLGADFFYASSQAKTNKYPDHFSFTIEQGEYGRKVFQNLYDVGVIKNETIAYFYARFFAQPDFKAGNYELPAGLDLKELIEYLSDTDNIIQHTVRITFYEDDNLDLFAKRISEKIGFSTESILGYWDDKEVVKQLIDKYEVLTDDVLAGDIYHPLEGYFAPNTYEFFENESIEGITLTLLDQSELLYDKYRTDFAKSDLSVHEIYTLASIIQYESGNDDQDDMRHVASVFYNRMAVWMPLQSTVTACYGRGLDKDGCKLYGDLYETTKDDNPYNTYLFYGLPPGPILCPGEKALVAALEPIESEDYYFVGDLCEGSGLNVFAQTLAEHEQNIARYIASCK